MADVLYTKDQTCPICNSTFQQTMVRSSLCVVEKRDSDFRVQYRNCNPNWYAIVVCPSCGYASPKSSFDTIEGEKKRALIPLLKEFGPVDLTGKRTLLQAIESFRRATQFSEARGLEKSIIGGLYLKTAWLYREMGETVQEHELLKKALAAYEQAYQHERDTKMAMSDLTYLIGELNRRTKRYEEAVIWFGKVTEMKDARPSTHRLAREMWQLAREAYRRGPAEHSFEELYSSGSKKQTEEKPVQNTTNNAPLVKEPPRRHKVASRIRIYHDQVEWLDKVGRWWGGEPELEASSVARALLDLVTDISPERLSVANEEELKKALAEHITARTGGDIYARG